MTADPTLGHLTPLRRALLFRGPSLGGSRPRTRHTGIGRAANDVTAHWGRHSALTHASSFQDVDPLSYSIEDAEEDHASHEHNDTQEDQHDVTILDLSGDSSDDHWALTPDHIEALNCESTRGTH